MTDQNVNTPRRRFLQAGLAAAVASVPVTVGTRAVFADALEHLDEGAANAKALKYAHDATRVDPATRGGEDRVCASCSLYTDASATSWGPCTLFPGKAVNANGWCSAWVKRAG